MHKAYSVPTDRPRLAVVAAALLTLSALPVHAATFTPPEGCKLEITVQNRGCTIDGVPLEVTRFELTTYSEAGDVLIQRKGQQFISRAHGRFYGGIETSTDWTGAVQESNDSPVTFSFPGQTGFGVTKPEYDCDLQMVRGPSAGTPRQLMKESRT